MSKRKLLQLSKIQTTKLIVFTIFTVWILCTFILLGVFILKDNLSDSRIDYVMVVYGHVTLAMNTFLLGYLAKSTYENQHKYGNTPYGQAPENQET